MTSAWPSNIPQCPTLGMTEQRQPNIAGFSPDVGPPKMRRRSTAVVTVTAVTYRMNVAQLASFNTFYQTTLADGTLPFTWKHPVDQLTYTWMFDSKQAPTFDRVTPSTFRVTFNLLRLP